MSRVQLVLVAVCVACTLLTQHTALSQDDGVREPPVITKPSKERTEYIARDNARKLECHATGKPTPTYQWRKNGETVTNTNDITVVSATGELIFNKFDDDQEGTYMCFATNVYDSMGQRTSATSISPPIHVVEQVVTPFRDLTTLEKSGSEHEYLKILCRGKGKIQLANTDIFNWYKGEKSFQVDLDNGRLFVDLEGTLHFTYLKTSDAIQELYRCGVSNGRTNIVLGSPTEVRVTPASSGAINPQFQYSNTGVQAKLFKDAQLECFFSGFDPASATKIPTIKWFDDASNQITSTSNPTKYSVSDDGRTLTIKNVQETDEKNYYCQGFNSKDNTKKERVTLDVISAPIFYTENGAPRDMTMPEHRDAKFHCNARSLSGEDPPQPPVWYINGVKAGDHNDANKHVWSADKKVLTVLKLSKRTDIQCVQCSVSNKYGTTWGDACLNVILGITLVNDPIERQEIKKGDVVNLTVIATTDPSETLNYSWDFKNETYLVKPPHVIYNPTTKEAFINTSLLTLKEYETIGGVYTRILTHVNDNLRVPMEVVLKDGPAVAPVVSKGGIDMWIIGLIIGILFLIIVIVIIIFVVCRKKQEGDYNVDKKETGAGLDPEKELKEKGFDDYSRPTYDDYEYPEKKPRGELEYDDVPIGGDDESLAEYGDETDLHFNEDGSFIGVYQNNRGGQKGQPKSTESTI